MYFVVFATHKQEMGSERLRLSDAFTDYVHDATHHPDVTLHHGGPTLGGSDETVTGLLLVLEAPRSMPHGRLSPTVRMPRQTSSPTATSGHGTG